MADLKNNIINTNIAGNTSNILVPDAAAIASGIEFKSNINSNVLNGYYNLLSEAVQYLQFTGGLYDESADYGEGNIASLVIKNGTDYSIWQFRRNANNPSVLNNNPPISRASITTVNGVDAYEGGTLNTDWDKLTEDYAIEATANTVMGRDSEGASNVNMPSSVTNTSIVNNQYLQQQLQAGLSTKQDTLTAGTNITIEDNVISASGDLATKAELVTYDNTNTNLEYVSGYDFPKFKTEIPETIDFVNAENVAISIKKTNNDYFIEYKAFSPFISNNQIILHQENTNLYKLHSTINQFFETVSESEETYYEALDGEILWEEITNIEELQNNHPINEDGSINYDLIETRTLQVKSKFKITNGINSYNFLIIKSEALEEIAPNTICLLTLNIKNRVLRNEDTNIFACSNGFMTTQKIIDFYHFTLVQNNDTVILKGEYTQKEGAGLTIGFYSPIIENYFDTPDISSVHELKNTNGITSSSGKPLKFGIYKTSAGEIANGKPPYLLLLMYQDDTDIQVGDTITFNLTPDKNFTLNPIYQDVRNVQQAIETLADNVYDYSGVETLVPGETVKDVDGVEHQVYRQYFDVKYNFLKDGVAHVFPAKTVSPYKRIEQSVEVYIESGGTIAGQYVPVPNNAIPSSTFDNNSFSMTLSQTGILIFYNIKTNSIYTYTRYRGWIKYYK